MTNYEWIIDRIQSMSKEELAECIDMYCDGLDDALCADCTASGRRCNAAYGKACGFNTTDWLSMEVGYLKGEHRENAAITIAI